MDKKGLKEEFDKLYAMMSVSGKVENMKLFGAVMRRMMYDMIEAHPESAAGYVEQLKGMRWNNYLTEKEAVEIVSKMKPDAPWSYKQWQDTMERYGFPSSEEPYYNCYALFTEMNKMMSDHSDTYKKYSIPAETQFKMSYSLAVDNLTDKDGVYNIRKYFDV